MTAPVPLTTRKHVLVVDDDPDMRDLLAEVLIDEGYSVRCAGDGAEALSALDSTPTDAILLDLRMSGMNGYEFLGRRAADPRLAKIPVIVMSGSTHLPPTTVGTSVLYKPIDMAVLIAVINECSAFGNTRHHTVTPATDGDPFWGGSEDVFPADIGPGT